MSLRYMGTKRALAPVVRDAIGDLRPTGPVADLFSGMGSVAMSMAPNTPVLTNDALAFTTAFARARFLPGSRVPASDVARRLFPDFRVAFERLRGEFDVRLRRERAALAGGRAELQAFMEQAGHVGTSARYLRKARSAAATRTIERYSLAVLYFSGGYFSTAQAAQLDALRYAIDRLDEFAISRDWLIAAWLGAAGVVINSPGHAAQFLKPGNDEIHKRIRRQWQRSVWSTFIEQLDAIQTIGTTEWRASNRVHNEDALSLVASPDFDGVSIVYADPPYTKDHYSRFYHVYETLYQYDFPESHGAGRYRADRFHTGFSLARGVEDAFRRLFAGVATLGLPLVLSYPDNGLLQRAGVSLTSLIRDYFSIRDDRHVTLQHSTLGGSSGSQTKSALEGVYVCVP